MNRQYPAKEQRLTGAARSLRKRSTDAEQVLWRQLRNREMAGVKFRRQHPIGNYVVDFFCKELGLVIELDGSQHMDSEADRKRDESLGKQGYGVLRFWNNEVLTKIDSVLERIWLEIEGIRRKEPSS